MFTTYFLPGFFSPAAPEWSKKESTLSSCFACVALFFVHFCQVGCIWSVHKSVNSVSCFFVVRIRPTERPTELMDTGCETGLVYSPYPRKHEILSDEITKEALSSQLARVVDYVFSDKASLSNSSGLGLSPPFHLKNKEA